MRVIYADSMFLLNFTVDYLLLLATGKICALPLRRGRMALGAAWGGVYALLAALIPAPFANAWVKILAGLGCAAIAYAPGPRFARSALVFFAVGAAFGGAVYAAVGLGGGMAPDAPLPAVSIRTLVLSFALCYAILSLVFRGLGRRSLRQVETAQLWLRGRSVSFRALRDTGSELRDNGGRPVMTVGWSAVAPLFPELSHPPRDPALLCLAMSELEGLAGRCRVLPCQTVTDSGGLLAAFRPDLLLIGGRSAPCRLVAVTMSPVSPDGDFQALF